MTLSNSGINVMDKVIETYNDKGMSGASELIIIILVVSLLIFILKWGNEWMSLYKKRKLLEDDIFKEEQEQNKKVLEEERNLHKSLIEQMLLIHKETSEKQVNAVVELTTSMKKEMEEISEKQQKLLDSFNSSIVEIYRAIDVQFGVLNCQLNSEKQLNVQEADKLFKVIIENQMYKVTDFILVRLSDDKLYEDKVLILDDINSEISKRMKEGADRVDSFRFEDIQMKQKLFTIVQKYMGETHIRIAAILDVSKNYNRKEIEHKIRQEREKFHIKINALKFSDL